MENKTKQKIQNVNEVTKILHKNKYFLSNLNNNNVCNTQISKEKFKQQQTIASNTTRTCNMQ